MKANILSKTAVIPPSIHKKLRVKSGGNNNAYDIEIITYMQSDNNCRLFDTIEATSLVDAYDKAQEIANKLSDKLNKEDAFHIVSVTRNS